MISLLQDIEVSMKRFSIAAVASICAAMLTVHVISAETESISRIVSVKVYQNQALIEREATVRLVRGENTVVLTGLPRNLHDWSVKSGLAKGFDGRIMSVQVEQKMLVERFQKKVGDIEDKLKELRRRDQNYIDELDTLRSQEKFVDSVLNFTVDNASKELQTRIPQVKVWDDTLAYCAAKKTSVIDRRRKIESAREELGREIQKWEFELEQIAGRSYYSNFQALSKVQMKNRSNLEVQQYAEANAFYGQQLSILRNPSAGTDIEKRIVLSAFSSRDAEAKITFSYLIPNTSWDMVYDIRASKDTEKFDLTVYGDVYQKTGEDWNEVKLLLSTGAPSNRAGTPYFTPWYLTLPTAYRDRLDYAATGGAMRSAKRMEAPMMQKAEEMAADDKPEPVPEARFAEKGAFVEMELPLKQSIASTDRKQKKYIRDYSFAAGKSLKFLYECYTWHARDAFLSAEIINDTNVTLLPGSAQVFIENEYSGVIRMPALASGKKQLLPLGAEPRLSAEKVLVKKYEEEKGVFGGKLRVVYTYQINVENTMKTTQKLTVRDRIPVSQNEKIVVEIRNASIPPAPEEGKEDTEFQQGQRKYALELKPGEKRAINYELVVTYDKEAGIQGLN
jgi:uncharacterized protein (TIGR02231 family)